MLPRTERDQILHELAPTEQDREALLYSWKFWARPKQLPPAGDWFVWFIRSGRGFGKNWTGSQWVIHRARNGPYEPIALVGQTKADARDTMIELGPSSIMKLSPPDFAPKYEPSKRRLTWPNGVTATVFSGDEPDQLRGPQHGTAFVDELAKFKYPRETWDMLMLGLRLGGDPRCIVTSTPRPIPIIREILAEPDTVDVTGSTYENRANLAPAFFKRVTRMYEGTRQGRQELYGEILDDVPGALWTYKMLENTRMPVAPELTRIVVAIDPAITATEDSDETGIIVAGMDDNGHGYCLEDVTIKGSPDQWARRAIDAYHKHQADRIIYESNQGGDMVAHTLRMVERDIPLTKVTASRGKRTRAEPVAALYEQGRCHHVGMFAELEDQLCTWVPGENSPDRLDALVWAMTNLIVQRQGTSLA